MGVASPGKPSYEGIMPSHTVSETLGTLTLNKGTVWNLQHLSRHIQWHAPVLHTPVVIQYGLKPRGQPVYLLLVMLLQSNPELLTLTHGAVYRTALL